MSRLELKVPPDLAWVCVAALMWAASVMTPRVSLPSSLRATGAVALAILGVWAVVAARVSLGRAETTWGPMTPQQTTRLVTSGVYHISRNPIYLGMWLVLLSLAVASASPAAALLSGVFVLYLNRFQIGPEERVLTSILGREYEEYVRRVRRWI